MSLLKPGNKSNAMPLKVAVDMHVFFLHFSASDIEQLDMFVD